MNSLCVFQQRCVDSWVSVPAVSPTQGSPSITVSARSDFFDMLFVSTASFQCIPRSATTDAVVDDLFCIILNADLQRRDRNAILNVFTFVKEKSRGVSRASVYRCLDRMPAIAHLVTLIDTAYLSTRLLEAIGVCHR